MTARPVVPALLVCAALLTLAVLATPSSSVPSPLSPQLGRTFVVSLVSGTVTVKSRGSARSAPLTGRRVIPVGSTVNATRGKVRLVGAVDRSGARQSGVFYRGAFRATQEESADAVIDLRLVGGNFNGCGGAAGAASAVRRRLGRRLVGIAHGNFRSRGKHSAATVRGTKWLTQDRCASTGIEAYRGKVETTSVDSDAPIELAAGESIETVCVPNDEPGQNQYCLKAQSAFFDVLDASVAFLIFNTRAHQGDYTLCIQPPSGDPLCRVFPLNEPSSGSQYRGGIAICYPDGGKGTYKASWTVGGQVLGVLPFKVSRPWNPGDGRCPTTEGVFVPGS